MYKRNLKYKEGFTLIEVVIYIGLFGIMVAGLIVAVYQLSEGARGASNKVSTGEEINFVLKKLDYVLNDASDIINPVSGTANELEVNKTDYDNNPILVRLNETESIVEICEEDCSLAEDFKPITTKNVTVGTLSFKYMPSYGVRNEGIEITLVVDGITSKITKYLKHD
jgi:type II secretory pathway pseudopilin PulG